MPPHSKGRIRHDMADCPDTNELIGKLFADAVQRGASCIVPPFSEDELSRLSAGVRELCSTQMHESFFQSFRGRKQGEPVFPQVPPAALLQALENRTFAPSL